MAKFSLRRFLWDGFQILNIGALCVDPVVVDRNLLYFHRLTLGIIGEAAVIIALVIGAVAVLEKINSPVLQFSWLSLFGGKSDDVGENINLSPAKIPVVGVVFLAAILFNLPTLAYYEEMIFRQGLESYNQAALWSLIFGLCHCLAGVSIAIGLALSIGGMWFSSLYLQGTLADAITGHTAYNLIVVSLILLGAVAKLIRKWMPDAEAA